MKQVDKNINVLEPMVDVLDKKNIINCLYYSDENDQNECCLVIDTSKLSFVNRTIIYAMADIYFDNFSFSDELYENFLAHSVSKKTLFDDMRYACFHFPNFGHEYSDYTKGLFLEFANAFMQQEPVTEIKNLYTADEMDRHANYLKNGCEDKMDFRLIVSLGTFHHLRSRSNIPASQTTTFGCGKVITSKCDSMRFFMTPIKIFELTTDRALNNLKKYREEKEKQKTKIKKDG